MYWTFPISLLQSEANATSSIFSALKQTQGSYLEEAVGSGSI
jgi:hypothetical protein